MGGVRTEWVAFGAPAVAALACEIRAAKGDDPLAPVTVVVPANQVGVAARRRLASGSVGRGVRAGFRRGRGDVPDRLPPGRAARIGPPGRRGATPGIDPGHGAPPCGPRWRGSRGLRAGSQSPGHRDGARRRRTASCRDLSAEALDAVAAQSRRAADVVRLHRRAHRALAPAWYDEEDLFGRGHRGGPHRLGRGRRARAGRRVPARAAHPPRRRVAAGPWPRGPSSSWSPARPGTAPPTPSR